MHKFIKPVVVAAKGPPALIARLCDSMFISRVNLRDWLRAFGIPKSPKLNRGDLCEFQRRQAAFNDSEMRGLAISAQTNTDAHICIAAYRVSVLLQVCRAVDTITGNSYSLSVPTIKGGHVAGHANRQLLYGILSWALGRPIPGHRDVVELNKLDAKRYGFGAFGRHDDLHEYRRERVNNDDNIKCLLHAGFDHHIVLQTHGVPYAQWPMFLRRAVNERLVTLYAGAPKQHEPSISELRMQLEAYAKTPTETARKSLPIALALHPYGGPAITVSVQPPTSWRAQSWLVKAYGIKINVVPYNYELHYIVCGQFVPKNKKQFPLSRENLLRHPEIAFPDINPSLTFEHSLGYWAFDDGCRRREGLDRYPDVSTCIIGQMADRDL